MGKIPAQKAFSPGTHLPKNTCVRPLLLLFPLAFLLAACSPAYLTKAPGLADYDYANEASERAPNITEGRKLIYSAALDLEVAEPDSAVARIVAMTAAYAGFLTRTSTTGATIRVPAARLDAALAEISTLGRVKDKRITGDDVTEAYFDMGIRLDNAEKSRQRYLELLARAQTVEETLLVERELERLTETIDLLKGKRNRLDQLEAYSVINIELVRKAKLGPLGYVVKGAFGVVKWLFVRN